MPHALVEAVVNACRVHPGDNPSDELRSACSDFINAVKGGTPSLVAEAAQSLIELPPSGAAWLAMLLGACVENGSPLENSIGPVVETLRLWLSQLPGAGDFDWEEADPPVRPEEEPWLEAFPQFCQSVVTHLARAPELRADLRQDEDLVTRLELLEDYTPGAVWMREALIRSSGQLVILHPKSRKGLRLHYQNVGTCFHLFSLLQTAVGRQLPGGRRSNPDVADACRGRSQIQVVDAAWWHYGDPHSPSANVVASIWGEASVDSIPSVNGVQVMLLWPPIMASRSWGSGFFGPTLDALPPEVLVEAVLTKSECQEWFSRLGVKTRRWFGLV